MNIAFHVKHHSQRHPGKPAIIADDRTLSYFDLEAQAGRTANALAGLGVRPGDRVALFLPNGHEFVSTYLGVLKLGAIAVSLNAMLQPPEVEFILNDCRAAVVVTSEQLRPRVPDEGQHNRWQIVVIDHAAGSDHSLTGLLDCASPHQQGLAMPARAPAAIVYTSGTTGVPKGATLSHSNVISNMYSKIAYCHTTPSDRLLLFLPLFHCFGQNAILNHGLAAGATIVLQNRFDLQRTAEAVEREQISMFFGVPTVYVRLLEGAATEAFRSVRYFFTAGASMPPAIAQRWHERFGRPIYEGYGLTETSPFASYNHERAYKFGSIGTPIKNVSMKVVGPDGIEVPTGERGELLVRGPNVMLGYWNRPQETAKVLVDGWFHTGDVAVRDDEGYFAIVDRLKDMINTAGFKVYPAEVENTIYQHPAVAEVAVFGAEDPVQGEVVRACVCLKAGELVQPHEIITFCRQRIATFKIPRTIDIVDSIPKNATGKVLRRVLRAEARAPKQFAGAD